MSTQKRRSEDSLLIKTADDPVGGEFMEFNASLILEKFVSLEKSMTLQLGCSSKDLAENLLGRLGEWSRLIIIEPSNILLDNTRLHLGSKASGRVFFKSDLDWNRLPFDDGVFQTIVSVLFWDRSPNRFRMFHELSRVSALSGMALLTVYLKDSAREFFDLYSEVITQFDMPQLSQPLQKTRASLLSKEDYQVLGEEGGFGMVKALEHPFKMRFESSKEMFACPLIQVYWIPLWEQVAGTESERIFWHLRQAMDRYFSGRKTPLTINVGLIQAIR